MVNSLTRAAMAVRFCSSRTAEFFQVEHGAKRKCETEIRNEEVVRPPRLERGTLCLEGRCSIQLSYGRNGRRLAARRYRRKSVCWFRGVGRSIVGLLTPCPQKSISLGRTREFLVVFGRSRKR